MKKNLGRNQHVLNRGFDIWVAETYFGVGSVKMIESHSDGRLEVVCVL